MQYGNYEYRRATRVSLTQLYRVTLCTQVIIYNGNTVPFPYLLLCFYNTTTSDVPNGTSPFRATTCR